MFYIEQGLELFSTCITLNLIVGMELHGLGVKSEDSKSSLATFRIFFFFFLPISVDRNMEKAKNTFLFA